MSSTSDKNIHKYSALLVWDGNIGHGTSNYMDYGRGYRVCIEGKPDLIGSADPLFLGDAAVHNPEELFVAALSSCHMLSYLALCSRNKVNVLSYQDRAHGTMRLVPKTGGGKFEEVTLEPLVTIAPGCDDKLAMKLHDKAHDVCFIANSVRCPVRHNAIVRVDYSVRAPKPASNEVRA